jgi:IS1 family transposase
MKGDLAVNVLSTEKQADIVTLLVEGLSIRSIQHRLEVHRDTVTKILLRVGRGCSRLHDRMIKNLQISLIQLDEQWSYVGKKQKRITPEDLEEKGDTWFFVAFAANEKAVISYVVGKRMEYYTNMLARDLRSRVLNRPQITSDGFVPYIDAIEDAFGVNVKFAQLVKKAGGLGRHQDGPFIQKMVISGNPDPEKISTSFVESFNLSTRMGFRRFVRRTNAFSKRLENHKAALALWVGFYNFCRVHSTLRTTPAVALGVTAYPWSIPELIEEALSTPLNPDTPEPGKAPRTATPTVKLRVIPGGKLTKK